MFVTQDSEQPPKKPRVDDQEANTSELDVPGRFPGTPSVADSTSVTGSAAGGPTNDATDNAKAKTSVANDTAASNTDTAAVADTTKADASPANETVTSKTDSEKAKESTDAPTSKTDNVEASKSVANDSVTSEKAADTTSAQKADDDKGPATAALTDTQPASAPSVAGAGSDVATGGLGTQLLNQSSDVSSTQAATFDSPLVAIGVDSSKVVDAGTSAAKQPEANQTSTTNGQSSSQPAQDSTQAAQPEEVSKENKPEEVAPAKNDDVTSKADSAPAKTSEPEQKPQETPDRAQSTAAVAQTKSKSSGKSEKKGGLFSWIKRKFKGEKSEKAVNGTTSN